MAEYNLSGRIKVEGIGDYIADMGRAEKATRALMQAAKNAGKLDIDTRDALSDLGKVDRALKDISDVLGRQYRLDIVSQAAVSGLQDAERAARGVAIEVDRPMRLNLETGGAVRDLIQAEQAARGVGTALNGGMTLTVTGVDAVARDLGAAERAAQGLARELRDVGNVNVSGGGLDTLAGGLDRVATRGEAASRSVGGLMSTLGEMAARGAMYELVDLAGEMLLGLATGFLAFDQSMTEALAITKGVNGEMRAELESTAVTISGKLGVAVEKVADIYYDLFSSGMTAESALKAVGVVAEFGTASMIDYGKAGEYLVTAQNALGLAFDDPIKNMEQMTRIANDFVAINNMSVGTVEDFAKALTNKAGTAVKTYGLDVEEAIATLGAFAERGILGLKAGEQFSMMIRDLGKSFSKNKEVWEEHGVAVFNAAGEFRGAGEILTDLNAVIGPMSDQMAQATLLQMGLTLRSQQTILTLLDAGPAIQQMTLHLKLAGDEMGHVADNQMEAYRKKLDVILESTQNFAYQGMETGLKALSTAAQFLADTFGPAAGKVVEFLGLMWQGAQPVLEAFGAFAGLAIVGVLQGIATGLDAVFGFLNSNQGVVEAFGAALAVLAGMQAAAGIATLAGNLSGVLMPVLATAKTKVAEMILAFTLNQAALGSVGAIKAGVGDLIGSISGAALAGGALVGLALLIGSLVNSYQDGKKAAQQFADEAFKKNNADSSIDGLKQSLTDLQTRYRELTTEFNSHSIASNTASALPIIGDLGRALGLVGDNALKSAGEMKQLEVEMAQTRELANQVESNVGYMANAFATNGTSITKWIRDIGGMDLTPLESGLVAAAEAMNLGAQSAEQFVGPVSDAQKALLELNSGGKDLGQITTELEGLAIALDLDLTGPFEEWAPTLAKAYVDMQLFNGEVLALAGVARVADAATGPMNEAMVTLSSETTSLTDKFEALKSVMDEIFGADMSTWDASTAMQKSLADLGASVKEMIDSGGDFNTFSEKALAARDSLSGAVSAAIDYADALGRSTGDMGAGAAVLGEQREAIIKIMEGLGMARDKAEDFVNQLGLTPERIQAMQNAGDFGKGNLEDAAGAAGKLNEELGKVGGVTVPVEIDQAMALSDLAGLTTAPYAATVTTGADTTPALGAIGSVTAAEHRATITADGNTTPASTAIGSVTAAEHRTTITANGNTQPASAAIGAVTTFAHLATITAQGNTAPAQTAIGSVTAAEHRAMIVADANTAPARTAIGSVQTEPWHAVVGTTADIAPARNAIGSIQTEPWRAIVTAQANTAQANADLSALSQPRIVTFYAQTIAQPGGGVMNPWGGATGGVLEFARGGMTGPNENHIAQIAGAGTYRMWAEQETGGEGYIPLANDSRRGRAIEVWGEIGKRFGLLGGNQWQPPGMSDQRTVINIPANAVAVSVNAGVNVDRAELAGLVSAAVTPAVQSFAADVAARIRRR